MKNKALTDWSIGDSAQSGCWRDARPLVLRLWCGRRVRAFRPRCWAHSIFHPEDHISTWSHTNSKHFHPNI